MAVNSEQGSTVLKLWVLLRRVGDQLSLVEDSIYGEYGLTSEQFGLLACIKSRGALRPSEIASMLERSPNSMSMLVDRMVKSRLVKRTRDRKDRRTVFVSMTDKGKEAVDQATPAGWEFINKLLSRLGHDKQRALLDILETVMFELASYANPETDVAEIIKRSFTRDPGLHKRFVQRVLPSCR